MSLVERVEEYAKNIHVEDLTIPNLEEYNRIVQECNEEFEEMSMFQHKEEYAPLIKKLNRLAKLEFIAGVFCSQHIDDLKDDEVNKYFKEQYNFLNQQLCETKIIVQEIKNRRDDSGREYEFV